MTVIFRLYQNLELITHLLILGYPDSTDLDDLTPDMNRKHLLGGR
jgi:hypothetical protein